MQAQDKKFAERMEQMKKDFEIYNQKIVIRKCVPLSESSDNDSSSNKAAADDKEDSGPIDESAIDVNSSNSSYDRGDFINEEIHNRYLSL